MLFLKYDSNLIDLLRYALLRVETLDNIGLFNGKLGIAIIFYEYSRYSKNKLYEEYASEIIDSISEIPNNLSLSLSDGLWGMSYLFFKQYIGGNIEYALSDLDRKIISNLKSLRILRCRIDSLGFLPSTFTYFVIFPRPHSYNNYYRQQSHDLTDGCLMFQRLF